MHSTQTDQSDRIPRPLQSGGAVFCMRLWLKRDHSISPSTQWGCESDLVNDLAAVRRTDTPHHSATIKSEHHIMRWYPVRIPLVCSKSAFRHHWPRFGAGHGVGALEFAVGQVSILQIRENRVKTIRQRPDDMRHTWRVGGPCRVRRRRHLLMRRRC